MGLGCQIQTNHQDTWEDQNKSYEPAEGKRRGSYDMDYWNRSKSHATISLVLEDCKQVCCAWQWWQWLWSEWRKWQILYSYSCQKMHLQNMGPNWNHMSPCNQGITVQEDWSLDWSTLVVHQKTYLLAYSHKIQPVRGEKFWKVESSHAMDPPKLVKMVGRLKV